MDEHFPGNYQSSEENLRLNHDGPDLKIIMKFYLAIFVLLLIFGSLFQTLHFEIGMILTQVLIILLPSIWLWKRYGVARVKFARLYPLQLKFIPTIILLTISMWLLNIVIAAGLVTGLMEFGYEPIVVLEPPQNIQEYLSYVIVLSIFAGTCEEVLFRGTIMPSLEKYGQVPAIVFSSLLFALFHISFLNLIGTFILGMVMAVIVIKTGSLWGGILYHMLNNFIAATYLYIAGQQEVATEIDPESFLALFPLLVIGLIGSYIGFRMLSKLSGDKPLLKRGEGLLPQGWFSLVFVAAIFIFLVMALLELALGFGWFGLGLN